jgi:2-dehydropantoate 2-reductase
MRLAVRGSGGIGGYYGALLAKGGHDVAFIARGAHLEALQPTSIACCGKSSCSSPAWVA